MLQQIFLSQYNKCFNILIEVINNYNDELWFDREDYKSPAWQIAYHGLYYTNIYCSPKEESIVSWPEQRENYELFGKQPWPAYEEVLLEEAYTKKEMSDFLEFVSDNVPDYLKAMRPDQPCWPFWYDQLQMEFHITNLRHFQHHIAEMIERHDIFSDFPFTWQ